MDKKRLGVVLHQNFLDEIYYAHYYEILETLIDNMAEYLRQYVGGADTEKECLALLAIANQDITGINRVFRRKTPLLEHFATS
jgi:hypothetical protein